MWGGDGMVQRCDRRARGHRHDARDHPGRHRQPARHEPRHPEGHRGGRRDRALGRAPPPRRRPHERRALRRDGRRGLRRAHDRRRRRHAQGPLRAARLRLDGRQAPARQAVQAKIAVDGTRWYDGEASCILFGNVGQALRRRRGVRGRAARRRHPRARRRLGRRDAQWVQTIARAVVGSASTRRRRTRRRCTPCGSSSTRRCRTSSMAAIGRRSGSCGSISSRGRSRCVCRCRRRRRRSTCAAYAGSIPVVWSRGSPIRLHRWSSRVLRRFDLAATPGQYPSSGSTDSRAPDSSNHLGGCSPSTRRIAMPIENVRRTTTCTGGRFGTKTRRVLAWNSSRVERPPAGTMSSPSGGGRRE